ncbi:SDR family NAD(P)-dependent oxidoreductase [Brevundimonas sp. A19_0]|uniref:SDR family NAD(P)-dependent oxidoreductase n=1 Tax=Brevundimonas sp. A19_0 TaxID=2821087 RepID=UPI001ADD06BF|nr:SDR family NAD(P)-dependent oxidoreductase [Brevundimonas sp. A19_0]MBO9500473.1 SDR family NAD(P)-dependent oxidoreductase [Brevundimonas sp. A19_0]
MSETSAVVIGASGGIGAALVEALETAGGHAVVHALSRSGTGLDLEDEASIAAAAHRVAEGPPPALVLVATGVLHGDHAPERTYRALSAEHLLRDYRLNAVGPALVAKHFLPLMPRTGRSVFGALSARVGSIGDNRLGGWHAYRASKAALNMLIRNLAIEHARTHREGIVVGLHPGTVATDLSAPFQAGVAPDKLFTPARAAAQLLTVTAGLSPADTGKVFAWDGQPIIP